jgi:hypothetical protein
MSQTSAANWTGWMFDIFAVIFFCAVLGLIWQNARNIKDARAGNTAVVAVLAVFCALMGSPDRFQTFKFSFTGIEASARQAIQQVQVTLEQLQKMAGAFADANMVQLALLGQTSGGIKTSAKFELHDSIINSLKKIGTPDDKILEVQSFWIGLNCRLLLDQIDDIASQLLSDPKAEAEIENLSKVKEFVVPLPETIRNWTKARSLNDPKLNEILGEYERVWTTGTMKNPDLIPYNQQVKPR